MYDLLIRSRRIVTESGEVAGTLLIRDGKIAAIAAPGESAAAAREIDAGPLAVLPGGVDTHTHFNDPGLTDGEDFYTGTASAAAGGITTVLEMPLTDPLTADESSFAIKQAEAARKAVLDYGLYIAATPENVDRLPELLRRTGACGIKAFMPHSPEIPRLEDGQLLAAMRQAAAAGAIMAVHCENHELIEAESARLRAAGRKDPLAHPESRPPEAEADAIQRAILLARLARCKLHVVHISLPEGVEAVNRGQAMGVDVTGETCPQYLSLSHADLERQGTWAKCNPPLRAAATVEAMWDQVLAGRINMLVSDHAPYTFAEKEAGAADIWQSPAGVNNIQTMLPLLISEGYHRRGLPLTRVAEMMATTAARRFGLYPRKGAIRPGADADLVLVDLTAQWEVTPEVLFYKQPWTPFMGMWLQGRVTETLVRGRTVYRAPAGGRGEIAAAPGSGAFLRWSY